MKNTFIDQLNRAWHSQNSLLCVGIDPDLDKLPTPLKDLSIHDAFYAFGKSIIDATAPHVCSFKPQIAYFAAHSAEDVLQDLIRYSHEQYPHIPVILDAKRGDIGSTATQYAKEAFERYRADAVTVNPYMGRDSIEPYLAYPDKGVIILCRTSNSGGSDVQFLNVQVGNETRPLYQHIAHLVAHEWNTSGQYALVVGATFPDEIRKVRAIIGDMPLLIPGIGAQGGDLKATLDAGLTHLNTGVIINSSRAIIYAKDSEDYQAAMQQAAAQTQTDINQYRNTTV
ncbi:orotidine 5'-phosphate decarboxylase [Formosimonas limnophila]|uniref:Orotidine 5'-phosphate decarboxylase n=1 Tax=Formosimonas limnophila TaxID=1384487 RepID=A0A8J3CNK4_9BURK|nr:orotidine-5'-phosphate decarboxylase [Formosimonas limnophila]GHA76695.1 orotidine 5'-phosphate decarboxylase [Formosimonas limnophila]